MNRPSNQQMKPFEDTDTPLVDEHALPRPASLNRESKKDRKTEDFSSIVAQLENARVKAHELLSYGEHDNLTDEQILEVDEVMTSILLPDNYTETHLPSRPTNNRSSTRSTILEALEMAGARPPMNGEEFTEEESLKLDEIITQFLMPYYDAEKDEIVPHLLEQNRELYDYIYRGPSTQTSSTTLVAEPQQTSRRKKTKKNNKK